MQRALSAAAKCVEVLREATDCALCSSPTHALWCPVCSSSLCVCTIAQHQSHRSALLPHAQSALLLTRVRALSRWARLRSPSSSSRPRSATTLRVKPPSPSLRLKLRVRPPRSLPLTIRVRNAGEKVHKTFSERTTQTPPSLLAVHPPSQQRDHNASSTTSPPVSVEPDALDSLNSSPSSALRSNAPSLPASAPSRLRPISPSSRTATTPTTITKRPRTAPQPPNITLHTPLSKRRKQQQSRTLDQSHTSEPLPLVSNPQVSPLPDAQPERHPSVTTTSLQNSPQSKTNHSPQQSQTTRTASHPVAPSEKHLLHTPAHNDAADDKLSEGTTNPGGRDEADMGDPVTPLQPTSTPQPQTAAQSPSRQLTQATKTQCTAPQSHLVISPLTTLKPKKQPQCPPTPIAFKTDQPPFKPDNMHTQSPAFCVSMSDFTDQQQYDLVFELITQMGGEPLPHLRSTRPNCLITPLHPTTGAIQTRKMAVLLAVALRVPIVGLTWLLDSFTAGTWLPLQPFDASASFHRSSAGVFKGVVATIDQCFEQPDASDNLLHFRHDIKRLITSADGVVVQLEHIKQHLESHPDLFLHIHVVKDQNQDEFVLSPQVADDKHDLIRKFQNSIGFTFVNMNWISECLFTGQCPPPERSETITRSTQSPTRSHSQGCTAP